MSRVAKRSKNSPYLLHHLRVKPPFPGPRPLSRQYVCSNIQPPRKIYCSELEEFILGPQKDLVCQLVQGAQTQTSLLVDIRDHRCVVGAHQHMMTSQVWEEYFNA